MKCDFNSAVFKYDGLLSSTKYSKPVLHRVYNTFFRVFQMTSTEQRQHFLNRQNAVCQL